MPRLGGQLSSLLIGSFEERKMKRGFDLLFAIAGLVFAAPLLAVLALLIRLGSPGPAIFRQVRVGRDGKPFVCLKLRTMFRETTELPTHLNSVDCITPIGKRLRRWKLDELPQLWNVLVGDMSLVGPRPCLPSQVELIEERRKRRVLALRPGITGLAQIYGVDMSDPAALARIDAAYMGRADLCRDLGILLGTISSRALADRTGQ